MMSGTVTDNNTPTATKPEDLAGQVLDLDEDDDLEVFSKDATFMDGSSFNSPMPTSPGSMVNQYKFEEEEEVPDTKDIFVTVDKPESHVTAIETFITYRVLTKTSRSEFDSSEYEVRRRYQDFLWLKGKLEETHPTLIVHPLPEKFVMKGMMERFSDDFVETRKRALHKFLNRIADHPVLSCSEDFKIFLTAEELGTHKKQGPGFLSRIGDTVRAVAASVRGVRTRPEEFIAIQDYVEAFSQKMTSLDKVTQRIIKEQKEYSEELGEGSPVYTKWSDIEDELMVPLKLMASCLDRCHRESEEQVLQLSNSLLPTLHEYVLCTDTLKAVLRRRDNIQAELEAKTETLAGKKTEAEAEVESKVLSLAWDSLVGKDPDEVRQQRQQKLKGEMKEIKEEIDKMDDRLEWANNALKADWNRWQERMRADLRSVFNRTAEKNVEYYEKCLAVWESFLLSQKTEDSEGDNILDS
ncbi:sorting nexin-7 isoform X1 [Electrophorus electricus]|uniref:PX domain-containing protein n=1 Tax=Electrophorus electricus TaxID=8005 RepID=A0A4W4FGW1_ELEEL|nr:sorting nexin-7 isoform X1 [Electrophorus electricus]